MVYCFGDGKCIQHGENGYFKPFKCKYHCKLIPCYSYGTTKMPKWMLLKKSRCADCQKMLYNGMMMKVINLN